MLEGQGRNQDLSVGHSFRLISEQLPPPPPIDSLIDKWNLIDNFSRNIVKRVLIIDDSVYNLFVLDLLINQISPDTEIEQGLNGQECVDKMILAESQGR